MIGDKEVIINNKFVTLWYYSSAKIVHHEFHKFVTGGEIVREVFNAGAELFEKYGAEKWLSDDRENRVLTKEDTEWTQNVWRPRVLKAGWKYWAIILPENYVGKMVMNNILASYTRLGVTTRIFADPDEALNWLKAQ